VRQDRLHSLLDLAFQVPEILYAVDSTTAEDLRDSQGDLARQLEIQETALSTWLSNYSVKGTAPAIVNGDLAVGHIPKPITSYDAKNSIFNLTCETLCRICHLLIVESLVKMVGQTSPSLSPCPAPNTCAIDLRNAMIMLEEAAGTPICKARVMSAPLHFLSGYYKRQEDDAGMRWTRKTKEALKSQAPYLHWDALLPWCLLTLNEIPHYDADPYA